MREKGIGVAGVMLLIIVLGSGLLIGSRVLPPYLDFLAVKKAMNAVAQEPGAEGMDLNEARTLLMKRLVLDNVSTVTEEDLVFSRRDGRWAISIDYSIEAPLAGSLGVVMHFSHSTAP